MLGLFQSKPKLPVSEEQRVWADNSFQRLSTLLGSERMLNAQVYLPIPEHFPDPYDGTEHSLRAMVSRVATAMDIHEGVTIQLFDDAEDATHGLVPFGSMNGNAPGGLYWHTPDLQVEIGINASQLKDPLSLVATIAHELGHVILLRRGLVNRDDPDMEPLTDLLTVFLGFGVFNANSAFQFKQYAEDRKQGWSTRRLGYLSEELFGYGLARFAFERWEDKPAWAQYLATNVAHYFKKSLAWLNSDGQRLIAKSPSA